MAKEFTLSRIAPALSAQQKTVEGIPEFTLQFVQAAAQQLNGIVAGDSLSQQIIKLLQQHYDTIDQSLEVDEQKKQLKSAIDAFFTSIAGHGQRLVRYFRSAFGVDLTKEVKGQAFQLKEKPRKPGEYSIVRGGVVRVMCSHFNTALSAGAPVGELDPTANTFTELANAIRRNGGAYDDSMVVQVKNRLVAKQGWKPVAEEERDEHEAPRQTRDGHDGHDNDDAAIHDDGSTKEPSAVNADLVAMALRLARDLKSTELSEDEHEKVSAYLASIDNILNPRRTVTNPRRRQKAA